VDINNIKVQFTGDDKGLTDLQRQILQLQREELELAAKVNASYEQSAAAVTALNSRMGDLHSTNQKTAGSLGDITRGAAASLFGFSLLAGGAVVAGHEIASFAQSSVAETRKLEQEIANISSIKPEIDTSALYAQLSDMQTRVPATAHQLAQDYYNIASSIQASAYDTLTLTKQTAEGARAALADVGVWGAGVVGVLNAYKMGIEDVNHVQDVFFLTVKNGVITGQQLATTFGPVAQGAQAAGQSFEFAAAAAAAVTKEGGNAADNMTRLKDLFEHFGGEKAQQELHRLGVETTDQNGKFLSFITILEQLKTKLDVLSEANRAKVLQDIFPDVRARQGLDILLRELPNLRDYLKQNQTQAGTTQDAIGRMMDTTATKAELLNNRVAQVKEGLGQWLDPIRAIGNAAESEWGKKFNDAVNNVAAALGIVITTQTEIDQAAENISKATVTRGDAERRDMAATAATARETGGQIGSVLTQLDQDFETYSKFVDGSLSSADQALKRHREEYDNVKATLERDLQGLEVEFATYMTRAVSSTGAVTVAVIQHASVVYAKMMEIIGMIQTATAAWTTYQAAAGGGVAQQFATHRSEIQAGVGDAQNAAATADAQAAASAAIAENAKHTKTAAEAAAALAKANVDAQKATVAHDQAVLKQAEDIDKLRPGLAASNETLAARRKLLEDNAKLTDTETKSIAANAQATIAAADAAAAKKAADDAKKADAAADSSRIGSEYIEDIKAKQAVSGRPEGSQPHHGRL
jgi:TP901 family phage tail tape measure protein